MICDRPDRDPKRDIVYGPPSGTRRHCLQGIYIGEIVHYATTSQKLLAHHDAAGTSELSDVAARSHGMNRCSGHASSVDRIHRRVGASVRHLCSV